MSEVNKHITTNALFSTAATFAAVGAIILTAFQSDLVARRWLLTPQQLQKRRVAEFRFHWRQAIGRAILRIQYTWAATVGLDRDRSLDVGKQATLLYKDPISVQEFAKELLQNVKKNACSLRVVRIGKDETLSNHLEHYVWILDDSQTNTMFHQLPLNLVATVLADHFEREVTTTALCFVADASAQQGSDIVVDIIKATVPNDVQVLPQPFWMACLAVLLEQRVYPIETMTRTLFALCRLEAMRRPTCTTMLVTLPGQAVVPQLLPLLFKAFPDDRIVFTYTGCKKTVLNALTRQKSFQPTKVLPSMTEALTFPDVVSYAIPLVPDRLIRSSNVMDPYVKALAALSVFHAGVVQTWMAAVDCYLILKEQDEKKNLFLPYCCKLDNLLDQPVDVATKNDSYWALRSLFQYITGTRTTEVSLEHIRYAASCLNEHAGRCSKPVNSKFLIDDQAIENAVFQHKLILIENKTFKDTVQPAQHWTLKAAVKQGCACCIPEDDDDDELEQGTNGGGTSSRTDAVEMIGIVGVGKASAKRNGYMDGRTTFAFDPSRFAVKSAVNGGFIDGSKSSILERTNVL